MSKFQTRKSKHHEILFKRREECERFGLGRNINKLPKGLRRCDDHQMECTEGKSLEHKINEEKRIITSVRSWFSSKNLAVKSFHNAFNNHENKGVGYTRSMSRTTN